MKEKINMLVVEETAIAYQYDSNPSVAYILWASGLKNSRFRNSESIYMKNVSSWRMATWKDFDEYNVSYEQYRRPDPFVEYVFGKDEEPLYKVVHKCGTLRRSENLEEMQIAFAVITAGLGEVAEIEDLIGESFADLLEKWGTNSCVYPVSLVKLTAKGVQVIDTVEFE